MLKVAFRIDCGSKIGMGHRTRMGALADALAGMECECVFYCGEDEPVDYTGFDIVIIDTYWVDDAYIEKLNGDGRLLVCYDDNALYTYNCDVLINANLYAEELNFKFGAKRPQMLLGGEYALLRREFRETKPISIKKKCEKIFLCFGGSDLRGFTSTAVRAVENMYGIQLVIVLGALTQNDMEMIKLANEHIMVLKNPPDMARVMSECDIAVTAAGSMVYELAALGIPTLLITQADNQKLIAEYVTKTELMKCVGDWESIDTRLIESEVKALLENQERRHLESERLKQAVDRDGVKRVARILLEAAS